MSTPEALPSLPAHEINVRRYELFLVWPVFLQNQRGQDGKYLDPSLDPKTPQFLDRWVEHITDGGKWQERTGGYPSLEGPDAEPGYSEFVYFHPFVRQFLYTTRDDIRVHRDKLPPHKKPTTPSWEAADKASDPKAERQRWRELLDSAVNRDLRILERKGLRTLGVRVNIEYPDKTRHAMASTFHVETAWLYLFDTQIALAELRLTYDPAKTLVDGKASDEGLKLDYVLKLNDVIRRLFAAYWAVSEGEPARHNAGHCPDSMTLACDDAAEREITCSFGKFQGPATAAQEFREARFDQADDTNQADAAREQIEHVYVHREPHTNAIWRHILDPIVPAKLYPVNDPRCRLRFEQILDERVPLFGYLAVDQPRRIMPGDWLRLASVDDNGDSNSYPYSPEFATPEWCGDLFYDRFWHSTGKPPGQEKYQHTRWLFSGHGFVGVGDAQDQWFFTDEHAGALAHFRHHYFALGLIAHFHRASLLRFKHALAEAADKLHQGDNLHGDMPTFRKEVQRLQREFLRFRTRYWFAEISNQIQGHEIFDLWKKHLNTPALFDEVSADLEAADELLRQNEEKRRADSLTTIAWAGVIFAAFAPAFALFQGELSQNRLAGALGILFFMFGILGLSFNFRGSGIGGFSWPVRWPVNLALVLASIAVMGYLYYDRHALADMKPEKPGLTTPKP